MNHEAPLVLPQSGEIDKAIIMPAADAPAPPQTPIVQDPEKVRAVEAVFAAPEKESQTVAGLLGLLTGTAILHDVAVETFSKAAGEVEEEEETDKEKP
jgi:hypothetical protein